MCEETCKQQQQSKLASQHLLVSWWPNYHKKQHKKLFCKATVCPLLAQSPSSTSAEAHCLLDTSAACHSATPQPRNKPRLLFGEADVGWKARADHHHAHPPTRNDSSPGILGGLLLCAACSPVVR
jgi:hypothetical protein